MEKEAMTYRLARRIGGKGSAPQQFVDTLRGIALDGDNHIHAVGDTAVKVFSAAGELRRQWPTGRPGQSVAVDDAGRVWVGEYQQVEIYEASGGLAGTWRQPGLGLITAIGHRDGDIFLADANARCIRRYDGQGNLRNSIGDTHRKGGFHIPNGVVDFTIDRQGILLVANPGMHRVERWTAAGELLGHFGRFDGVDPEGFPGCCNPTNLAVDSGGRVIVTEKAGPRVKIYSGEGQLLAVVAAEGFEPGAKNMDVAVDAAGSIYVADTTKLEILVFLPAAAEAAA